MPIENARPISRITGGIGKKKTHRMNTIDIANPMSLELFSPPSFTAPVESDI
jgi:hypothetical protein